MAVCSHGRGRLRVHAMTLPATWAPCPASLAWCSPDSTTCRCGRLSAGSDCLPAGDTFERVDRIGTAMLSPPRMGTAPVAVRSASTVIRPLRFQFEGMEPTLRQRAREFDRAQPYGRAARIVGNLVGIGFHRSLGECLEERLHIRRDHRHIGRSVNSQPLRHEILHRAIFQRMVRLHHQTAADSKMEPDLRQRTPKLVEFPVHFDAQCPTHVWPDCRHHAWQPESPHQPRQ